MGTQAQAVQGNQALAATRRRDEAPGAGAESTRSVNTHCPYCALQCAMTLQITEKPSAPDITVEGASFPTNRGRLCRKGNTAAELLKPRPDRLLSPLIRDATPSISESPVSSGTPDSAAAVTPFPGFREATWDEALDLIVEKVRSIQEESGRDAVGVFGSGGLTNEKTYALGKFARAGLGTSQIDYNGRFCMSSASKASTMVFGLDRGLPFPLTDLDSACTILLLGSNVADTMPPFVQHLEAARRKGGLIVVDPRRSATADLTADGAGMHIAPAPGEDLVLLLATAHVVLEEGLADYEYLSARVRGLEAFRRSVAEWWPERAQSVAGVGANQIRLLARRLGHAARQARNGGDPVFILTGRGVEQHHDGTDTARAAISLALLLGLPGGGPGPRQGPGQGLEQGSDRASDPGPSQEPGQDSEQRPEQDAPGDRSSRRGGYGTLTGQGNGQGGREMGQKSDQLPGIRSISDPEDRAFIAELWGMAEEDLPGPGRPAAQLLHTMGASRADEGADETADIVPGEESLGVRALFVHGSNIAVSAPDADKVLGNLRALDLLVVADFFLSETAAEADVVLPVLQWAEEEGTMTSLEGRVLRRRRAVDPPLAPEGKGPRSELWVFAELARRLGSPAVFPVEPAEVFEEIREATRGAAADYSGLDWELLDAGHAAYWPVPSALLTEEASLTGEPVIGTARMFEERFAHSDGKARLAPIRPRRMVIPAKDQLTFTTGRVMEHYQSGTQTRRVEALRQAQPEATVELHPATAAQFGLTEASYAVVENDRGAMIAKVVLNAGIRTDTVFAPFHFSGAGTANLLTRGLTDPHSNMPEFKNTPANIRPATEAETAAMSTPEGGS